MRTRSSAPRRASISFGTAGTDRIVGGAGNDILDGGSDIDQLEGGPGDDTYVATDAADFIAEAASAGTDSVYAAGGYVLGANLENLFLTGEAVYGTGNALANVIVGTKGANVLSGGAGKDYIYGGAGADLLAGGANADVLEGGADADILYGNAGADLFRWRSADETGVTTAAADLVKDFSHAAGDRLSFAAIDAVAGKSGNQAFVFVGSAAFSAAGQIRYAQTKAETLILLNTDADAAPEAMVRLAGHHLPSADWFILGGAHREGGVDLGEVGRREREIERAGVLLGVRGASTPSGS